jgi:hypothetical protein
MASETSGAFRFFGLPARAINPSLTLHAAIFA